MDSGSAANWLERLPTGKFRDRMAISYIAALMKDDPMQSLHFVSSLHPSQQAAAGRMAADRLAESASIDEASSLLRTLNASGGPAEEPYLQAMFESLVNSATKDDRQLAISLVQNNFDQPFMTGTALARATTEMAKNDPIAALEWAAEIEGAKPDLPQGGMIAAAIGGMSLDGLKAAEKWAEVQPDAVLLLSSIERRKDLLEDRGKNDYNEYDKDD